MPCVSVEIPFGNILHYKNLRSEMNFQGVSSVHTNTIISHGSEERHCQGVACTLHVWAAGHTCLCRHNCRSNMLMRSSSVYNGPAKPQTKQGEMKHAFRLEFRVALELGVDSQKKLGAEMVQVWIVTFCNATGLRPEQQHMVGSAETWDFITFQ